MLKLTKSQRALLPYLAGFLVALIFAFFVSQGYLQSLDLVIWDKLQRLKFLQRSPDPRINIVAIDQESLDELLTLKTQWPWPRDIWARFITIAYEANASGILFDIFFDDPGIERLNSDGYSEDMAFAEALKINMPIILSCEAGYKGYAGNIPLGLLPNFSTDKVYLSDYKEIRIPHQRFQHATMGLANAIADVDGGIIRRSPLMFNINGNLLPQIAAQLASIVNNSPVLNYPTDNEGLIWLRYYGFGGPKNQGGAFPYLSVSDIILGRIPSDSLKNKILIVGGYAAGLLDYKPTPVANVLHPFPGCEIHATILSNILNNNGLVPLSASVQFLITIIIALIGILLVKLLKNMGLQIAFITMLLTLYVALVFVGFYNGVLMTVFGPIFACIGSVSILYFVGWNIEGKQRRALQNLFSRYLDSSVINEMLDSPEQINLNGKLQNVTVMFCDMVGFSKCAEGLSPQETVSLLNEYYQAIVTVFLKWRGLLDKYIGDAVVLLFGAPIESSQAAHNAVSAVLEVQEVLHQISVKRASEGKISIDIRAGIHTDEVIIGNIGHQKRMDYTAIGNGVNLASRLESANRFFKTKNLVSEKFKSEIPEGYFFRKIGRVVFKGMTIPTTVYELISANEGGAWVKSWNEAWEYAVKGQYQHALDIWNNILITRPNDEALKQLVNRLQQQLSNTGVITDVVNMETK